ncbi:uncharacterized protein [Dendrobates tinctorius]|uniref:uncharacterized protein isoform X1 n=1 Tax=Dendrobates tinctorius TaxID=92724 RepID=UPI003CC9FB92
MDLQRFFRNLRLRAYFSKKPLEHTIPSQTTQTLLQFQELNLKVSSTFMPPKDNPPIETFVSLVERDISQTIHNIDTGKFHFQANLSQAEKLSLEQLSTDKSLVIKPADKGGATVVMDRSDYLEEALRQLSDRDVYKVIPYNPVHNLAIKIKSVLEVHLQASTIDKKLRDYLIKTDPTKPVFYILPKIRKRLHKPPGRPIVSLTDSILSPLSIVLERILTPIVKKTKPFLLDTGEFIRLIQSLGHISPSTLLVTWDVQSLYTSITHEKGMAATNRLLQQAGIDYRVRQFCADLLELVLKENYFLFEDT